MMNHREIIHFWFEEIDSKKWWVKDPEFDQLIRERFYDLHASAALGELYSWRSSAEGRLAEVIILDQFSRNMFRDHARSFAYDGMALILAQECVAIKMDQELPTKQRSFLYMPYMHSESPSIHNEAVRLFSQPGLEFNLDFEYKHKAIIDRFGRYPHRNQILGRISTADELKFLEKPGSRF